MEIGGLSLRPYLMARAEVARPMLARCPLPDPLFVDILDPAWLPFYHLVNAANHHAFGGLGMPAWVQLDCCTLPSAMIGFAIDKRDMEPPVWEALTTKVEDLFGQSAAEVLEGYDGPVPLSEYCAARSFEPDTVVGFSLFSLRRGLGVRTKALALRCYGVKRQIGTTQYSNNAVRSHCAFGPLQILTARAVAHSRPEDTFVYALNLDTDDRLDALIHEGSSARHPPMAPTHLIELVEGGTAKAVQTLMSGGHKLCIVPPGHVRTENGWCLAVGAAR